MRQAEQALPAHSGPDAEALPLTCTVARAYFSLLAVKDEYEVARLHTHPEFFRQLADTFEGDYRLRFHLAPAWLARPDPKTGQIKKIELGSWILPPMRLLASLRHWRGTFLDPFRYAAEHRLTQRLQAEYEEDIDLILTRLNPDTLPFLLPTALQLAALPEQIRGYGAIRQRNADHAKRQRQQLRTQLQLGNPGRTGDG